MIDCWYDAELILWWTSSLQPHGDRMPTITAYSTGPVLQYAGLDYGYY